MVRNLRPETFRSRSNLVIAELSELAAPLLRLGGKIRGRSSPSEPKDWRRAALVGAAHIGDLLYNSGSLPGLKQAFPQCDWFYVCSPPASEVLANNPNIAGCFESLAAAPDLDAVVCYNSGGYWREIVAAARLGIPNRVGFVHKGFSSLVTRPIHISYPQPYPAYFRDLVAQLTGRIADWSLRPLIYPTSQDAETAEKAWAEAGLGQKPVVACFLTSRQGSGTWPARKFAETVACLEASGAYQTVLFGATEEAELLRKLKSELGLRAKILAGALRLLPLGCFLGKCATTLCPDSGPRHLSNAVQTPVVFVRNLAVGRIETGAYCETESDVAPDLERLSLSQQEDAFELLRPEAVAQRVQDLAGRK